MDDRIVNAWHEIVEFEDSISDMLCNLDDATEVGHLIHVEYPDSQTTIIRIPHDIEICDVCDKLFDPSKGCECQNKKT